MTQACPELEYATERALGHALSLLRDGQIVAIPTETVYGLAADATNGEAVARIYAAKGRPSFNPLIAHVSGADMAADHALVSPLASLLMEAFWPGPLTLVLPLRSDSKVANIVTAGLETIALRAPSHLVPQKLIAALGGPLAAPSANMSGRLSPTTAKHVAASLGGAVPLIIDGGACEAGLESTIVEVRAQRLFLLRPGPVTAEQVKAATGMDLLMSDLSADPQAPSSPGQLASHYAPRKPLRLNVSEALPDEFHIGFGAIGGDLNLSAGGSLVEAAAGLFAALHKADASPSTAIAVAPVPREGLGLAIADRLRRAATPGQAGLV
ncbi:threonylcarbamoyl-AMP synthase [Pacificimonas sp. WHA3]|uniref:Threonylcarbamoyl-AMP synthase n=1 Tax=Pacificimonas pallii TaxID=2827236 RepID=A0ABS6SD69_9SPHN|nr:L-threonylcarbamoyladenylate synthase [Pacificimonas pallii]MBV7256362.1 threonylcarbamoyl-AMP synthase [Pacificimonas pallii]